MPSRSPRMQIMLLTAALGAAACNRDATPKPDSCATRLAALEATFKKIDVRGVLGGIGQVARDAPLALHSRNPDYRGAYLRIERGDILVGGQNVGNMGSAAAKQLVVASLAARERDVFEHPEKYPNDDGRLYLVAPADEPAAPLLRLVRELWPNKELGLIARRPFPQATPQGASHELKLRIAAIEAKGLEQAQPQLVELVSLGRGKCEPLQQTHRRAAAAEDEEKRLAILLHETAPALKQCRCQAVDIDALEAAEILYVRSIGLPSGWLPLRVVASKGNPDAVSLPAGAGVAELVRLLDKAEAEGRALTFASEP